MFKNIITVLSGTVAAQLIGLLLLPVLTRIYSAEAFGNYQIYVASLNVLLMVVALRYELGILVARDERSSASLLSVILRVSVATSILFTLIITIFRVPIEQVFREIVPIVWLLPAAMLIGGVYQTLTFVPVRNRDFRLSATSKVLQSGGFSAAALLLPLVTGSGLGLPIADVVGRGIAAVCIIRGSKGTLEAAAESPSWSKFKNVLGEYKQYPTFTLPGTIMSALGSALVPVAFAKIFGVGVAGQYGLVDRFAILPVAIVAFAISQVVTGDLASAIRLRPRSVHGDFRRLVLLLALMGLVPAGVGYFLAPVIVPIVFGAQWQLAGHLCAAAMPVALVLFVAAPVNMVLVVCRRNRSQLVWEASRFLLTISLFSTIGMLKMSDPVVVMRWYSLSVVVCYGVFLILADRALAAASRDAVPSVLPPG